MALGIGIAGFGRMRRIRGAKLANSGEGKIDGVTGAV
jgi:hypothetical protein